LSMHIVAGHFDKVTIRKMSSGTMVVILNKGNQSYRGTSNGDIWEAMKIAWNKYLADSQITLSRPLD
jgi:hypothetical protein